MKTSQLRNWTVLSKFYMDARTVSGQMYKVSSLDNFRHSLKRYLQSPPNNKTFDIVGLKDANFRSANQAFNVAVAELSEVKGTGQKLNIMQL